MRLHGFDLEFICIHVAWSLNRESLCLTVKGMCILGRALSAAQPFGILPRKVSRVTKQPYSGKISFTLYNSTEVLQSKGDRKIVYSTSLSQGLPPHLEKLKRPNFLTSQASVPAWRSSWIRICARKKEFLTCLNSLLSASVFWTGSIG